MYNITAWGGEFGKEGEGRGEQVAISLALWRVHCAPPEKVHGLLVLKPMSLHRRNVCAERMMRWGPEGSQEGEKTQASCNSPNSSRIDRRSNRAEWSPDGLHTHTKHTPPDCVVNIGWFTRCKRVGGWE
nr:putative uncharacterized protein MGC13053 [Manis javanica]